MARAARALIDSEALRANLERARAAAPRSRVMAVIKADGYGHGIVRAAEALAEADAFGVACVEEAVRLREAGVQRPVVLLEGIHDAAELAVVEHHGLELVVHEWNQVRALLDWHPRTPVPLWIKVDSGMHRLGFNPESVPSLWEQLGRWSGRGPLRLMTHLANADTPEHEDTRRQLAVFDRATAGLEAARSAANSAAVLGCAPAHLDWVRPGLMLYGVSPFGEVAGAGGLRPAMTLATRLISVRYCRAGDRVGYGGEWTCPEDMAIGIAAIGYGDGYPRHARSGTPVLVGDRRGALAGRVSMDMLSIDLRRCPEARVGDPVILWGPGLPVEEVAHHAGTIPYQLLCGLTARVPLVEAAADTAG